MRYVLAILLLVAVSCGERGFKSQWDAGRDILRHDVRTGIDTTRDRHVDFTTPGDETTGLDDGFADTRSDVADAFQPADTTVDKSGNTDTLVQEHEWHQKGQGVVPEAFDFRGITGSNAGLYLVGAGPSAYLYSNNRFTDLTKLSDKLPPALYAVASDNASGAFVVGMHGFLSHVNTKAWGLSASCHTDRDCGSNDPCLIGKCQDGQCVFGHKNAPGCCGNTHFACDFDTDTCGITVQGLYSSPNGGIVWARACNLDTRDGIPRATSGTCALYFGNPDHKCQDAPDKQCPTYDNGNTVGATATIPWLSLPAAAGKVTMTFQTWIDVDDPEPYDDFSVWVVTHETGKKKLWDRTALPLNTHGFKQVTIPLDNYAGKSIQLVFRFDSKDDFSNYGEGVYVDDIAITSTCKAGSGNAGLPDVPLFAVCSGPNGRVFIGGAQGLSATVENGSVKRLDSGKSHDFVGVLSRNGENWQVLSFQGDVLTMKNQGAAFGDTGFKALSAVSRNKVAVGGRGLIVRLTDQGAKSIKSPVSVDLIDVYSCDQDTDIAVGKAGRVVRINGQNAVLEPTDLTDDMAAVWCNGPDDIYVAGKLGRGAHFDGQRWNDFQTAIQGTVIGIAGDGQGHVLAVGEKGQAAYFNGQSWQEQDSKVMKNLWSVAFLDTHNAIAVGEGGMIVPWKDGAWYPQAPQYNRDFYKIDCQNGQCMVLGQGIILKQDKAKWVSVYAESGDNIRDCSVFTADDALFVTTGGEVLRFNGKVFTLEPLQAMPQQGGGWQFDDSPLYGVFLDKNHQIAVGGGGIELRPGKDGVWDRAGIGQKRTLRDVCVTAQGDVFEVGAAGRVLHYTAKGEAHIEDVPGAGNLTGVWCGKGGVAVVGEAGQFYLY